MSRVSSGEELEQINVKVTESFLAEIDDTWQGRGFNSRSDYIRYVLRDAIQNPTFDRDELVALLRGERAIQEGRTYSREEVLDEFDIDVEDLEAE